MARHRNVRTMNYEDECYDDDDYLGHSVEDNYCISPGTAAQFTFNREKDFNLSTYMSNEKIPEEEEGCDSDTDPPSLSDSQNYKKPELSDADQGKLNSCLEEIRNILGDSTPDHVLCQTIVRNKYNLQASLNELLSSDAAPKPQREPRQNRRNRSQGDDNIEDDLDTFIESLESESTNNTQLLSDQNRDVGILKFGKQSPVVDSPIHNFVRKSKTDMKPSESGDSTILTQGVSNVSLGDASDRSSLKLQPKDNIKLTSQTNTIGFSLSSLAKQHSVGIKGQELEVPQVLKNKGLSSLGKLSSTTDQVSSQVGGASVGSQQKYRQPSTSSQCTDGPQSRSGPNRSTGLSLTDLIKQNKMDNRAGLVNKDTSSTLASRVSLADLAGQRSNVGETNLGNINMKVSLSDLALKSSGSVKHVQMAGQSTNKTGKSLADLASQHKATSGGADVKPNSVGKESVIGQLSGLSLADLAKNKKSQPQKGQLNLKSLRDLAPQLNKGNKTQPSSDVMNQPRLENVEHCVEANNTLSGRGKEQQIQQRNTKNDQQVLSEKFSELMTTRIDFCLEDETDFSDRVRMVSPSILAKTISSSSVCSKQLRTKKRLKFPKFSYQVQMCKVTENLASVKENIIPFDFSTPSPDDIVKEKQNLAFTRSGR